MVTPRSADSHTHDYPSSCGMGNLYRFIEPLVLFLLKRHGRTHGYKLISPINDHALTDSRVEQGALYRTLRRLEENGMVASIWDESGNRPARRLYELTSEGEEHLKQWMMVMDNLASSMSNFVAEIDAALAANNPKEG